MSHDSEMSINNFSADVQQAATSESEICFELTETENNLNHVKFIIFPNYAPNSVRKITSFSFILVFLPFKLTFMIYVISSLISLALQL